MFEIKSAKLHSNYILGRVTQFHLRTHWTSLTRSMTSSSTWWDLQWLASFNNVIIRVDWITITIVNLYHISSAGRQPSVGFRRGWRPPVQTRFFSFSKSSEELFSCFFLSLSKRNTLSFSASHSHLYSDPWAHGVRSLGSDVCMRRCWF